MKKRLKSMLKNSNPSLNTIDETLKPKPTETVNPPVTASRNIPIKMVKSSSEQVLGQHTPSSQHEDIKRKYKSLAESSSFATDGGMSERPENAESTKFSEETLDVFDAQLDQKQSPNSGILRSTSVPFASNFPWLARNNRASLARREANSIIDSVGHYVILIVIHRISLSGGQLILVICTLSRKITSFRQFENMIVFRIRVTVRVRAEVSGNTFSVKRPFGQV